MNDALNQHIWEKHQIWLRVHTSRERQRRKWETRVWDLARQIADVRHDESDDVYLWSALKGVEQAHWCWARRYLGEA